MAAAVVVSTRPITQGSSHVDSRVAVAMSSKLDNRSSAEQNTIATHKSRIELICRKLWSMKIPTYIYLMGSLNDDDIRIAL